MAINPETQYPGKIAPSTPDYPYGAARNITVPGDGTGTPWEAALVNDIFGWQQALLSEAGIVPTGSPEKATASQYLGAIRAVASVESAKKSATVTLLRFDTVADMVAGLSEVTYSAGQVLVTAGYYTPGDGGGAVYDVVSATGSDGRGDHDLTGSLAAHLRPVDDGNGSFANLLQFGVYNDGVTDNGFGGWNGPINWYTRTGKPVHCPKGDYLFNSRQAFAGVPITIQEGCTFLGDSFTGPDGAEVVSGTFKKVNTGANGWELNYYQDPEILDKGSMITQGDLDLTNVEAVDMTALSFERATWPGINPWGPANPAGIVSATDSVLFEDDNLAESGWTAGFKAVDDGELVSFAFLPYAPNSSSTNAVFIRSANHYVVYAQGGGNADITKNVVDVVGGTTQTTAITNEIDGNDAAAYRFYQAVIGVRKVDSSKYAVSVNGMVIDLLNEMPDGETIIDVGCGIFRNQAGRDVEVRYSTLSTDPAPFCPRPLKVWIGGDSITAPGIRGWPLHMTEILKGSLGVQVERMTNAAISGYTASDVLATAVSADLTQFNCGVVMVGTNDIKAQTNLATLRGQYESIIAEFDAAGVPLIMAQPPVYYSFSDAVKYGGAGGDNPNAGQGSVYRDLVKRIVSEQRALGKRVYFVDSNQAVPPVLARFLNSDLEGNRTDRITYDNIHPTQKARRWLGLAFAKAVLPVISGVKL